MRYLIPLLIFMVTAATTNALVINEIMSNPMGDDSGREWVEIYNNTDSSIDVSSLTISIKGSSFISVTPVSGGVMIAPYSYGIIGSTVSGLTRFMQDYPAYSGPLFRSQISLVNTGVTSLELKLQGGVVDTLPSYVAAKEGASYSLFPSGFAIGSPSPGEENKAVATEEGSPSTTPTGAQSTLPQAAPPSADITLYLPKEKIVVAGAPALFSVYSSTHSGKMIDNITYTWGFGDGGYGTGSSTFYRYLYPGRYIAQVDGTNGLIAGTGRMNVRVVSPDLTISPITVGKYGSYIDITNPNEYDIDLSLWKITIDGAPFSFPKNTLLAQGVTRFPGSAMGFASTTVSSSTVIRLLFQNMDEVMRITQGGDIYHIKKVTPLAVTKVTPLSIPRLKNTATVSTIGVVSTSTALKATTSKALIKREQKDVRLATFIKSFFSR